LTPPAYQNCRCPSITIYKMQSVNRSTVWTQQLCKRTSSEVWNW